MPRLWAGMGRVRGVGSGNGGGGGGRGARIELIATLLCRALETLEFYSKVSVRDVDKTEGVRRSNQTLGKDSV